MTNVSVRHVIMGFVGVIGYGEALAQQGSLQRSYADDYGFVRQLPEGLAGVQAVHVLLSKGYVLRQHPTLSYLTRGCAGGGGTFSLLTPAYWLDYEGRAREYIRLARIHLAANEMEPALENFQSALYWVPDSPEALQGPRDVCARYLQNARTIIERKLFQDTATVDNAKQRCYAALFLATHNHLLDLGPVIQGLIESLAAGRSNLLLEHQHRAELEKQRAEQAIREQRVANLLQAGTSYLQEAQEHRGSFSKAVDTFRQLVEYAHAPGNVLSSPEIMSQALRAGQTELRQIPILAEQIRQQQELESSAAPASAAATGSIPSDEKEDRQLALSAAEQQHIASLRAQEMADSRNTVEQQLLQIRQQKTTFKTCIETAQINYRLAQAHIARGNKLLEYVQQHKSTMQADTKLKIKHAWDTALKQSQEALADCKQALDDAWKYKSDDTEAAAVRYNQARLLLIQNQPSEAFRCAEAGLYCDDHNLGLLLFCAQWYTLHHDLTHAQDFVHRARITIPGIDDFSIPMFEKFIQLLVLQHNIAIKTGEIEKATLIADELRAVFSNYLKARCQKGLLANLFNNTNNVDIIGTQIALTFMVILDQLELTEAELDSELIKHFVTVLVEETYTVCQFETACRNISKENLRRMLHVAFGQLPYIGEQDASQEITELVQAALPASSPSAAAAASPYREVEWYNCVPTPAKASEWIRQFGIVTMAVFKDLVERGAI